MHDHSSSTSEALAERLRTSLAFADITPEGIADRLAITPGIVRTWLDARGRPKPLHLMMWAQVCGVPFEWLTGTDSADPA